MYGWRETRQLWLALQSTHLTDERFSLHREHTKVDWKSTLIGGPGAFVLVAKDFNSFGNLLMKKLIAEIARADTYTTSGGAGRRLWGLMFYVSQHAKKRSAQACSLRAMN
jgi:hypothetical protein